MQYILYKFKFLYFERVICIHMNFTTGYVGSYGQRFYKSPKNCVGNRGGAQGILGFRSIFFVDIELRKSTGR